MNLHIAATGAWSVSPAWYVRSGLPMVKVEHRTYAKGVLSAVEMEKSFLRRLLYTWNSRGVGLDTMRSSSYVEILAEF